MRPAQAEDASRLALIHLQTWQETYRDLLSAQFLAHLAASVEDRVIVLGEAIVSDKVSIWVAEKEGELVAWAAFGSSRDADALPTTAELRAINLLPQVWSQGIGRQLWQQVRQQLIEAGYASATAWVVQGNHRALGFYDAMGFVVEPETAKIVIEHDEPLPLIRYRIEFQVLSTLHV